MMQRSSGLGTFLGVYTPTLLTILGTIMYLRSGWLTGHLGIGHFLVIILLANAITLITSLSISSAATNIRVGTGGAYYIISRSLGMEIGGAVGVPLFLSQAFSVTLYAFGLAESLRIVWSDLPVQLVVAGIVLAVTVLSILGAELALKVQIPIMVLVGLSILALAIGAMMHAARNGMPLLKPSGEVNFWVGFAIFFPAVTGVMAGLGLSGDLRDPMKAIPRGTLLAVLTSGAIYLALPILLALGAPAEALRSDSLVWTRIAPLGLWLIMPGLWGAILSSAIGSMLGAPRTLKALADDGLAPRIFTGGAGERRALLPSFVLAAVIASAAILLGNLNAVAVVVTMFFLTVYGTVNLVAALEALSGDTSWRPLLRFPWVLHLAGGLACFAVMVLISPVAGLIAVAVEAAIWLGFSRKEMKIKWGDARRGLYENLIRWSLIRLVKRPMTARNWRPHILVFVSDPLKQLPLIRMGNLLSQERGVVTVCQLVEGHLMQEELDLIPLKSTIQNLMNRKKLPVFAEVDVVENVVEGIVDVAQANGMAGMHSNTVLLGFPSDTAMMVEFLQVMKKLEKLGKSLILARIGHQPYFPDLKRNDEVHVWWGGLQQNGDLLMLLAYLLTQNRGWTNSRIKIMSIASNELMRAQTEAYLNRLLPEIRIQAEASVMVKPKDRSVLQLIHERSEEARVVFLGLAHPERGEERAYAKRLEEIAGNLKAVLFVKNSSLFMGDLLQDQDATIS
jgi:potassium/chloride transporter 4/5/6